MRPYESAVKDKEKLSRLPNSASSDVSVTSSIAAQFDMSNDELVSAVSLYMKKKRKTPPSKCISCGYKHGETAVCPAVGKS